jgi:hypothetical protein
MASAKSLRVYWKSLKARFKFLLVLVSFLAATITVSGFTASAIKWFQGDWKKSEFYIWLIEQHREVVLMMVIHIGAAGLILRRCWAVLRRRKKPSLWSCILLGFGAQILLSLPAGIWQAVNGWSYLPIIGTPMWSRVVTPLTNWPFNAGGYTVNCVSHWTVGFWKWALGERLAVVLGNMPYYALLMVVQLSVLAVVFAVRYKKRRSLVDWAPAVIGILFLINSLANVGRSWAGP